MLKKFNNIKKNDDNVKEHYIVSYKPTGEYDLVAYILFGLVIFFPFAKIAYELWEQTKTTKINKNK